MKRKSKLTLQERSVIEISLYQGMTLEEIGLKLDRHPTTIAREIKSNRTLVSHRTYFGMIVEELIFVKKGIFAISQNANANV